MVLELILFVIVNKLIKILKYLLINIKAGLETNIMW